MRAVYDRLRTRAARRSVAKQRDEIYNTLGNSMLKDGVPLRDALSKLAERARLDKDTAATIFRSWLRRMGDAKTRGEFAECIRPDVPNSDYMVLRGFEQSGRLAEGLLYQSSLIARVGKMRSEFIMSMIKPGVAVTVSLLLSAFFSTVAENFLEFAPMEDWSEFVQIMFNYTLFISSNLLLLVGGLILGVMWLVWAMPNWGYRSVGLRHKLDGYMPFVMYRDFASFSTLVVMSAMMSAGMPLKVAAQSIMDSGTPWIRSYFRRILRRLGDSSIRSPGEAFNVGFFPKRIYYRVLDASERGDFAEAVKFVAEDSFDRMDRDMKARAFVLDQLSFLVAGAIFGLIAGGLAAAIGEIQSFMSAATR